jgi:hypothetical protein
MRNTEAVGSLSGIGGPSLVLWCYWLLRPTPHAAAQATIKKRRKRRGVKRDTSPLPIQALYMRPFLPHDTGPDPGARMMLLWPAAPTPWPFFMPTAPPAFVIDGVEQLTT